MKMIAMSAAVLLLAGCQSSTTNSYVYIGDAAFKNAQADGKLPTPLMMPLKAEKPTEANPEKQSNTKSEQSLDGSATNGTTIIIGVNSTTAKPVEVSPTANGNKVNINQPSTLKTGLKAGSAAAGAAIAGPAGAAAGAIAPDVVTEGLKAAGIVK